ncbi:MAG: SufD family Fe-S cluster assembly protein [Methanophagales archaeon]|nr:SufD family Fe-S cluster assembly protein [Methanophagales archaeon]MCW3141044.1 SufD family Fe-S cluster assembly protein [Methanophagales archaeon]
MMRKELLERARRAKTKKAALGEDIAIENFVTGEEHEPLNSLNEIPDEYKQNLLDSGIEPSEKDRSGSFLQRDCSVVFSTVKYPGLELMSTTEAFKKHDWLKDYLWKAIPVDMDKYTADVELDQTHGYFIRSEAGKKVTMPVQSCLFITSDKIGQKVHNIVIAEENSELHIITGCSVSHAVNSALHLGVSEFYVKRGAKITFTMIHNWSPGMEVRPRSAVIIEDDGVFISNYILMTPLKSLQMYPTAYCVGKNARATFQSIVYAPGDTKIDFGSRAVLQGEGSKAEIISRAIATDSAKIVARSDVIGEGANAKGHIECRGLMLSDSAEVDSIPELKAKLKDLDLSHEAAVGKIAEEEIQYLMARGLSEEEATSVIIRGFLNVDITGLPEALARETKKMFDMSLEKVM